MAIQRYEVFTHDAYRDECKPKLRLEWLADGNVMPILSVGGDPPVELIGAAHPGSIAIDLETYRDIFAAAAESLRGGEEESRDKECDEDESPAAAVAYWRLHGNERRLYSSRGVHVATVWFSSNDTWEWQILGAVSDRGGGEQDANVASAWAANACIERGLL